MNALVVFLISAVTLFICINYLCLLHKWIDKASSDEIGSGFLEVIVIILTVLMIAYSLIMCLISWPMIYQNAPTIF